MSFGLFQFASPPRTATNWIRQASVMCGLKEIDEGRVHIPHNANDKHSIKVMTVRHPCAWLASYYSTIYPGLIGVDAVDAMRMINTPVLTFDEYIRAYLHRMPANTVGNIFDQYNADVYLRIEDLPWSFIELLESLGVPKKLRERCLGLSEQNITKPERLQAWSPSLKARVREMEQDFISRFEYR